MIERSPLGVGALRAPLYPVVLGGIGEQRPLRRLASRALDARLGLEPGSVERWTGVRERAVADGESLVDLAAGAARAALRDANCDPLAIDCLIVANSVPHQPIPTSAVFVKAALGMERSPIAAFDVNATCLGFLVALDTAAAFIAAGRYERVLVVAVDVPTRGVDWNEPKIAGMFGDGAAAAVIERSGESQRGILAFGMETYTEGAGACVLRAGGTNIDLHRETEAFFAGSHFEMDGGVAYRVAARYLPRFVDRLLARAGVTLDQIDCVVPHQASATANALMQRRLGIRPERMIDTFAERGNSVAAALPAALAVAVERGEAAPGRLVLLLGTAAGISLGGAVWRM